jgi:2-oxoglutarate ferredoxin oxidoreductase subunit beta
MEQQGTRLEDVVLVSGIGCHAKIADYFNINSFYAIHGRAIPVASGIKLANRDLNVICCVGDGDVYAEGLDHLIFAAKRNIGITVIVHNNRVYGLTTGQYTPTSPHGFKGKSTPMGTMEYPLNPLELMLASGATYIARGYTKKMELLKTLMRGAIDHRGFAFIDVLQICATFMNLTDYYNARTYELPVYDRSDALLACEKIRTWDYNSDAPIALGLFYQREALTFDEQFQTRALPGTERQLLIRKFLATRQ